MTTFTPKFTISSGMVLGFSQIEPVEAEVQ
jgi:hypothetical protein